MINRRHSIFSTFYVCVFVLNLFGSSMNAAAAQETAKEYGPYHGFFIPGGLGLKKPFNPQDAPIGATAPWSMYCWVKTDAPLPSHTLVAGFGEPLADAGAQRYFALLDGRPSIWSGSDTVSAPGSLAPGQWTMLAATFDGTTVRLYLDGTQVADKAITLKPASPAMQLAPQPLPWPQAEHFGGRIAYFTLTARVLNADQIRTLLPQAVPLDVLPFEAGSKPWPVSTRATFGLRAQQDPATLPKSSAPLEPWTPVKNAAATAHPGSANLSPRAANQWALAGGWLLAEAPEVTADGAEVSRPEFRSSGWLDAIVPGTVLTTMVAQGIYPDPDYPGFQPRS